MKRIVLLVSILLGSGVAYFVLLAQNKDSSALSSQFNTKPSATKATAEVNAQIGNDVPKHVVNQNESSLDIDEMHSVQVAHTHKSVNGFTLIGTAVLNTEHYLEIMEKLAATKANFPYLSSHYWVEYWGEDENGRILFKLYDLMGFSDTQTEKSELAFQYKLDNLYGSENYGDSSPENESTVLNALNDLGIESPLSLSCARFRCMYSIEWQDSYDFSIDKIEHGIAEKIQTEKTDCAISRFNGFSDRQYITITCKDK
jgi:hypothetical protein